MTTHTSRTWLRRLSSVGLAVVISGVALLADPLTGVSFASGPVADPTSYLDWLQKVNDGSLGVNGQSAQLGAISTETEVGEGVLDAAGDAELTEVCVGTIEVCAPAVGGAAVLGGLYYYGSDIFKWAFGSGHPVGSVPVSGGAGSTAVLEVSGNQWSVHVTLPPTSPGGYAWSSCSEAKGAVYEEYTNNGSEVTGGTGVSGSGSSCVFSLYVDPTSPPGVIGEMCASLLDAHNVGYTVAAVSPSGSFETDYCPDPSDIGAAYNPGAGAVTVTGDCYNVATGAADGTVSGTSSWTGTATTIPDTDLPDCPAGDGLSGTSITGTGSAATVGQTSTLTPGQTVIPGGCLAEDDDCAAVWQESTGGTWTSVAPQTVPLDPGPQYRCEGVASSGAAVSTLDQAACPTPGTVDSPGPEPSTSSSSSPGIFGPPVDGDEGDVDKSDVHGEDCFPHGWGLLNPVDWVERPGICVLKAAFIPSTAAETELDSAVDTAEERPPLSVVTGVTAGFSSVYSGYTGGCGGFPDFSPAQNGEGALPCSPSSSAGWSVAMDVMQVGLIVSTVLACWAMLVAAFGGHAANGDD